MHVGCRGDICSIGFSRFLRTGHVSVENAELEVVSGPGGVRQVVERVSSHYAESHVLGGWMDHSLFASQADLFTNDIDPDRGATSIGS